VRATAGIGADQHPPPRRARQLRQRQRVASIWSAAVLDPALPGLDPALPGRSTMAKDSPMQSEPRSAKAVSGWNPKVFFHVGQACSLSDQRS
jgi:hypothetical protein